VRVAPGPLFGVDGSFESRLRLTYSLPAETTERGVRALASAWAALGGGAPSVADRELETAVV
jgi:DNA-binding transcriptional MocR family regulator